ncbi:MAG: hypothetical protein ACI8YQ_005305 [Polaribacter sp.]
MKFSRRILDEAVDEAVDDELLHFEKNLLIGTN